MSLISKAISHLFGGVSQQAASLRDPAQCELMENCWPDVAAGLGKRPPLVHGAKLNTDVDATKKVHLIDRDGGEQYVALLKSGEVKVYDRLTGTEKTVAAPGGTAYLTSASPKDDFSLFTVADTTFIVNRSVVTELAPPEESVAIKSAKVKLLSLPAQYSYFDESIQNTVVCAGAGYRVIIDGVNYDSTTATTFAGHLTALTSTIAAARPTLSVTNDGVNTLTIVAPPGDPLVVFSTALDEYNSTGVSWAYACGVKYNTSRVSVTTGGDLNGNVAFVYINAAVARQTYTITLNGTAYTFTVAADGANALTTTVAAGLATAIGSATFTVDRKGSLLRIVKNDSAAFTCTVTDSYGDQGMYMFTDSVESQSKLPPDFWEGYVIRVGGALDSGNDDYYVKYLDAVWKETVKPGLANSFLASTMPHKLTREADGTFTFEAISWASREVGDEGSNPAVSFVGKKINAVFFYRERLGFLSGEYVSLSKVSSYYTFWATTASGQLDDDPIDVAAADARVSFLYHALPFNDTLLLFSDSAQFQMSGGEVLSASTVRLDPTTRFSASKSLPPTAAGRNVFFAVSKGDYSSMREYFVTPDGAYTDALDITSHVPTYVPQSLRALESSSLTDSMFAVSASVGNELFCYKFMWEGEKKVQSSWGKWMLDSGATVVAAKCVETVLALVVIRSDGTYVETINLQTGGVDASMDRLVYLDRRVFLTGVYDAGTGLTTWTLPFPDSGGFEVVLGGGYGALAGTKLDSTKASDTTVTVLGDYSGFPCYVGKPYTQKYRFSEQFVRDKDNVSFQASRLQLRTMTVSFSDTGYFRMEVTPAQRETFSYPYTARLLGGLSAIIGTNPVVTGKHRFPIVSNTKGLTIDLINDSPSPSFFQGAEWEGLLTYRAKRV